MKRYLTTPFKRRWILSTIIVIILSVGMIGLGFWQLDRHRQRQAYIAGVIAEVQDAPFVLTGSPADDQYADRIYHQVQAEGRFDFENQVIVKNKFYDETMGYHLVTPFLIKDGDRAVLVDRGWVPPETVQTPADARQYDEPALTSILGRILATEESATPPEEPQFWWLRVDVASIGRQLPYDVLPFYVALTPPEEEQTTPPYRNPPKFELDPGAHFGFAIEWLLFAFLLPLFYLWLVVRVDRLEAEEAEESP
jgi:surfeit locus 1 family protein